MFHVERQISPVLLSATAPDPFRAPVPDRRSYAILASLSPIPACHP